MKQKYIVSLDPDDNRISIREFAQVERDGYCLLCEEIFDVDAVRESARTGKERLIDMLRTQNMYPPVAYTNTIAEAIMALLNKPAGGSTELMFNDKDTMAEERQRQELSIKAQARDENAASSVDRLLGES